ncbi:MAG: hypothetical protein AAFV43_03550 [Planctomycetota bacterium]
MDEVEKHRVATLVGQRRQHVANLQAIDQLIAHCVKARDEMKRLRDRAQSVADVYCPDEEPVEWPADLAAECRYELTQYDELVSQLRADGDRVKRQLARTGSTTDPEELNQATINRIETEVHEMAIAQLISNLRRRRASAARNATQLAVAAIKGEQVQDGELDAALVASGMTTDDFEQLVKALQQRKAAQDAAEDERFFSGLEEAKAERSEASNRLDEKTTAMAKANKAAREAHDELNRASGRATQLQSERERLVREKHFLFDKTGGGSEWHDVDASKAPVRPLIPKSQRDFDPQIGGGTNA